MLDTAVVHAFESTCQYYIMCVLVLSLLKGMMQSHSYNYMYVICVFIYLLSPVHC